MYGHVAMKHNITVRILSAYLEYRKDPYPYCSSRRESLRWLVVLLSTFYVRKNPTLKTWIFHLRKVLNNCSLFRKRLYTVSMGHVFQCVKQTDDLIQKITHTIGPWILTCCFQCQYYCYCPKPSDYSRWAWSWQKPICLVGRCLVPLGQLITWAIYSTNKSYDVSTSNMFVISVPHYIRCPFRFHKLLLVRYHNQLMNHALVGAIYAYDKDRYVYKYAHNVIDISKSSSYHLKWFYFYVIYWREAVTTVVFSLISNRIKWGVFSLPPLVFN